MIRTRRIHVSCPRRIVAFLSFFVAAAGLTADAFESRGSAMLAPDSAGRSCEETAAGWYKYENNPVLGGSLGTCFDVALLKEDDRYRMWFSWRPKDSVALVESPDGAHWSTPVIVLEPNRETGWERRINRPVVVKNADGYHMWYTGQSRDHSWIGYAQSTDGVAWRRVSSRPVISPEESWEKAAVMCPHVIWDEKDRVFRMWYSGGEQYEPDAVGYATSLDGQAWTKHSDNPVFRADEHNPREQHKVTACQVVQDHDWHLMFYIGFRDEHRAQIGVARSRDGISNRERHPANPVIFPGRGKARKSAGGTCRPRLSPVTTTCADSPGMDRSSGSPTIPTSNATARLIDLTFVPQITARLRRSLE